MPVSARQTKVLTPQGPHSDILMRAGGMGGGDLGGGVVGRGSYFK